MVILTMIAALGATAKGAVASRTTERRLSRMPDGRILVRLKAEWQNFLRILLDDFPPRSL
jgi:hypothetical protein